MVTILDVSNTASSVAPCIVSALPFLFSRGHFSEPLTLSLYLSLPRPLFLAMDEEYDVIVLGTGLKECILSGLLSVDGFKVLHMDRNGYYGGESTSLNLVQARNLWKRFRGSDKPPAYLGPSRDYNVDMIPKVCSWVPFIKYGLNDNTTEFIGHALALHRDDQYLNEPALDTVKRMKMYAASLSRFQGGSPYIYPLYGLAELPQAFARLSAAYGGTYMLNKPECKLEFDTRGKAYGVTSGGMTARCKKVVCDPSYLPNKVRKVGKVARAIAIMSHPIPDTHWSHSVQIILPQKQLGRRYLFCCSYLHKVAPKGKFIAFVSTEAETDRPEAELKPGIDLLGPVDELFFETYDRYRPINTPSSDHCFISTSYDATTHFESTVMDVLSMYTMITGKTIDLNMDPSAAGIAIE
ncbi:Rab GDP dissociation inhibitor [Musa troglodytarum]|uniref:Rab GDP dissociation inhibitor n=1 Tax=Musa troglodytarum TaxID=320322 RepID=A0A9E7I2F3_9LILI|nr:Rab GDP dissociation inhibitor [Musa troglodytarum]URE44695.1 Rab GDP dissociation inhibitor [Musa troglodytarum]